MKAVCANCGKTFERSPKHIQRVKVATCSVSCRGALRRVPKVQVPCTYCGKTVERCPSQATAKKIFCNDDCLAQYRGTEYSGNGWISQMGYRYIYVDGKAIFEHRYIMEQHLGRKLSDNEVVHHINKDRLDNRLENLQLMDNQEHTIHHNTGKSRKGQKRPPVTDEIRQRISDGVKRARSHKFWSTRQKQFQNPQ